MGPITVNAVAFRAEGLWIAQCLEYNLTSCAETLEELPDELLQQLVSQIKLDSEAGLTPFANFKPAPARYWKMYEAARAESAPLRPKKSFAQRLKSLLSIPLVDPRLFQVPANA